MSLQVKATKVFKYLPCGHAQYFDKEPDGSPGECASIHGYDREVEFTFAGEIDEHGWIVPFGELGPVKKFLEYYFDHVTVLPADDPRIGDAMKPELIAPGGLLGTLRILPSGVSMEMSSVFIWEHVNAYIHDITNGRCYVERVRVYEHNRNDAMCEVDRPTAQANAVEYLQKHSNTLPLKQIWPWEEPKDLMKRING